MIRVNRSDLYFSDDLVECLSEAAYASGTLIEICSEKAERPCSELLGRFVGSIFDVLNEKSLCTEEDFLNAFSGSLMRLRNKGTADET